MKLPHRRQFLRLAGGGCCAPGAVADRTGTSLSDATGAHCRRLSRRGRNRHRCAHYVRAEIKQREAELRNELLADGANRRGGAIGGRSSRTAARSGST
jgi:hypothetical protein